MSFFQNIAARSPQLGSKHVCVACSVRFYDMTKSPPVCPKCGTVQPPETARFRAPLRETRRTLKTAAPAVEATEADIETGEMEDDEDVEAIDDEEDVDPDAMHETEHDS